MKRKREYLRKLRNTIMRIFDMTAGEIVKYGLNGYWGGDLDCYYRCQRILVHNLPVHEKDERNEILEDAIILSTGKRKLRDRVKKELHNQGIVVSGKR